MTREGRMTVVETRKRGKKGLERRLLMVIMLWIKMEGEWSNNAVTLRKTSTTFIKS